MQAAGYLVSPTAELTAGMKDRKDHFDRRKSRFFLDIDRNSPSVIDNGDGIVGIDLYIDGIAVSRKGLIYRVVYDLIYQMVKSPTFPVFFLQPQVPPKSGFDLHYILRS